MSEFGGVLELQVETLLGELRRQQENRCRELIAAAETRAQDLLQNSRHELRERVRQAVAEERRRRELALQQARHRVRTEQRHGRQALYARLLSLAWPALASELERRWSGDATRKAWCEMLIEEAESALSHEPWTIECPANWTGKDQRWLIRTIRERGLPEPTCRSCPEASAGLKIRHGSACLDGSIDGLLARRSRVEGLLLAAWEEHAGRSSSERHD